MPYVFTPGTLEDTFGVDAPVKGNFTYESGFTPSNPTEGMSGFDKFRAGWGAKVADTALGAKTLMAKAQSGGITDLLAQDPSGFNAFQEPTDTRSMGTEWLKQLHDQAAEKRARDKPLTETFAGAAGGVGADVANLIGTAGVGGMPMAFASNAALGALEPTTAEDSITKNAIVAGLKGMGGQAVADTFGLLLRGVKPATEQIAAAKEFAEKHGGVLTRGQLTGSELWQRIERMAAGLGSPWSRNADAVNSGATKRAFDKITGGDAGKLYDDLAPYSFTVDKQLANVSKGAGDDFALLPESQRPTKALDALNELFQGKPGTPNPALAGMGPRAQQSAASQGVPLTVGGEPPLLPVGKTIPFTGARGDFNNFNAQRSLYRKLSLSDEPEAAVYGKLADALDAAADRNLVAQGLPAETMLNIRRAYSLEKVINKAAIVDDAGNVTGYDPVKVASIVRNMERTQKGRIDRMGDVGDTLRGAAAFGEVAKPVKSSGTAENIAALSLIKDAVDAVMHGGNVAGALSQGLAGISGAVYFPRAINYVGQMTRNGILPEATSKLGKGAAEAAGRIGTSAARALPLSGLTLGDLLQMGQSTGP